MDDPSPLHRRSLRADLGRGVAAAVIAVILNAGIVVLNDAAGIAPDFRALSLPPVTFLSAVGALGTTAAYRILSQRSAEPDARFVRIAVGVLVVSFVPDLTLLVFDPAATLPGVALLMVMHVVVAAVAVGSLVGNPLGRR